MTIKVWRFLIIIFFVAVSTASAEPVYYIGGGPSIPLGPGGFTEAFHGGWDIHFGIGLRYYHFNEIALIFNVDHFRPDDDCVYYDGGKIGVSAVALEFRIRNHGDYYKNIRKCLIAGIGISNVDYENRIHRDRSEVFLGFGAGMEFLLNRHCSFWIDAKFHIMSFSQGKVHRITRLEFEYKHQSFVQLKSGLRFNIGKM